MFAILNPHSHSGNWLSEARGRNYFDLEPFFERQFMVHPLSVLAREAALAKPGNSGNQHDKRQLMTLTDDKFEVKLDVSKFSPDELNIKIVENSLVIEGKHEEKDDPNHFVSHNFIRKFQLPDGVILDKMTSTLTAEGTLLISSPREIVKPVSNEKSIPITHSGNENSTPQAPLDSPQTSDANSDVSQ